MAIAVVQHKQTGSAAAAALTITEPAVGNILAVFATQTGSEASPTFADNGAKGTEGWTRNATEATGETAKIREAFFVKKVTEAGITELKLTPGAAGTAQGISYVELSGASTTVREIVAANALAKSKTQKSGKLTSASGDLVFVGLGDRSAAGGLPGAWTSEPAGHVLNQVGTESTRMQGGYLVTAEALTAVVYVAEHATETAGGMLAVALEPGGAQTFTEAVNIRAGAIVAPAEVAVYPTAETVRAGARTQPLAAAVFPASIVARAGARTSPSTALNISVAPAIRAGARMALQAVLVAPAAPRIRAGAQIVAPGLATFVVAPSIRAGARTVVTLAGAVTYTTEVSIRAGAKLRPTVASPTPVGKRTIIFIFEE